MIILEKFRENLDSLLEDPKGYINEQAYMASARLKSEIPVIFIDPNKIDQNDPGLKLEQIREQLDAQVPGSADVVFKMFENNILGTTQIDVDSPWSLSEVYVGESEYCIITMPDERYDNVLSVVKTFFNLDERNKTFAEHIAKNMELTDLQLNTIIGAHEGEHCNSGELENVSSKNFMLGKLAEETRADRSALDMPGIDDAAVQTYMDIRHLSDSAPSHKTGLPLEEGVEVTEKNVHASLDYKDLMGTLIYVGVNYDVTIANELYERGLNVIYSDDLLNRDPEMYFSIYKNKAQTMIDEAQRGLEQLIEEGREEEVYNLQDKITDTNLSLRYAHHYEAAYRRRVLGEAVSDEPLQINIPTEVLSIWEHGVSNIKVSEEFGSAVFVEDGLSEDELSWSAAKKCYENAGDWLTQGDIKTANIYYPFCRAANDPISETAEDLRPKITYSNIETPEAQASFRAF
jgi:hypothetical protein